MALTSTDRARTTAQWMRENRSSCAFTKQELRAAVDAADDWVESAFSAVPATSYTGALAAGAAGFNASATAAQKAAVLAFVLWRRIGRLRAEEDA